MELRSSEGFCFIACMPTVHARRALLALTAATAVSMSGCSLIPLEVTADGKLQFEIRGETNTFSNIVTYDPNDNEDYRKYKDQFDRGQIESILITVLRVYPNNKATWVAGQVDVRPAGAGDDAWVQGVSEWGGLRLMGEEGPNGVREALLDEIYLTPAEWDNFDELNRVVFQGDKGALEFRVQGVGNEGPVEFDIEVTVTFTVEN